jgi:hypothetical protein
MRHRRQCRAHELTAHIHSATKGETTVEPLTVREFATDEVAERQQLDLDWKNDASRLGTTCIPRSAT